MSTVSNPTTDRSTTTVVDPPFAGGIILQSANAARLQALADTLHVLTHNAHAFELAAPGSPERAEAGLAMDVALREVKAMRTVRS